MTSPARFYDELAPWHHLIFADWERSIARQAEALDRVLRRWPAATGVILDVAAGIGTQTLGLAGRGYRMIASDISAEATRRCRGEARRRGLEPSHAVADFRALPFGSSCADAAIACDNALPHLLTEHDLLTALAELVRCVRPGGGVVLSVRDYAPRPAGTVELHPYGERTWQGTTYEVEQEWHWHGATYTLLMRFRPSSEGRALELETTYYAIPVAELMDLMRRSGLRDVRRLDDVFYQPLLVGTVPEAEHAPVLHGVCNGRDSGDRPANRRSRARGRRAGTGQVRQVRRCAETHHAAGSAS